MKDVDIIEKGNLEYRIPHNGTRRNQRVRLLRCPICGKEFSGADGRSGVQRRKHFSEVCTAEDFGLGQ